MPVETKEKLKHGYKRVNGEVLSPDQFGERFVRRIIVLPIHKPCGDVMWKDFGKAADDTFREGARIGNLAMRMFSQADKLPDAPKDGGKVKLPKWEVDQNAVYAMARQICPAYPSGSVSDLLQRLRGIYQAARFDMMVTFKKSLPSFTRGRLPLSIRAQDWQAEKDADGNLFVWLRLGSKIAEGLRGQRLKLQLRRANHHAHAAIYEKIIAGEVQSADAKLKPLGDGLGLAVTVMLPRKAKGTNDGVLMVRTDPESLLVWNHGGDDERPPLHADQLKRMLAARTRQNQRWSDQLKFEKRWPAHVRRRMNQRHDAECRRWNDRITGFIRLMARITIEFAKRRGCGKLVYDDHERSFAPLFAWAELSAAMANGCAADGIEFLLAEPIAKA